MDSLILIRTVINSLDKVTVQGKENLSLLLGSINALEQLAALAEKETEKTKNSKKDVKNDG